MSSKAIRFLLLSVTLSACSTASAATGGLPAPSTATPFASPSATPTVAPAPTAPPATPSGTPAPRPTAPATPPASAGAPADYCRVGDTLTPSAAFDDYAATYLDWTYRLPSGYVPPDLVSIGGGKAVRAVVYEDLSALQAAALAAGHPLFVVSAYRSYALQAQTFDYWTGVGGYQQALLTSARPGHSEHQLGTAIDFGDGSGMPWERPDWAATPAGAWLAAHAADFGFVMSFPKGKTAVTCYAYEPWHYRYVGRTVAHDVAGSGVTLHEYQMNAGPR